MKIITQTKICTKCKITKELSEFSKNSSKKNGFQTQCKLCEKAYKQSHYEKNKDRILKKNKEYRNLNKEPIKENNKKRYKKNKEAISKQKKEYVKQNKEATANYQKEWREQNKEYIAEYSKEYRKTEAGRLSKKNSEGKRRKAKLSSADGTLPQNMTYPLTKELQELLHAQNNKCNNCRCDITKDKHLDHHIPLSKGGTHSISNVVFLCPTCNLTKHATMPNTLLLVMV